MKDVFAKDQQKLESCQPPYSFFELVDDLWHHESNPNPNPLRRLCTLMRKMKVKSLVKEELELNEELLEEQNMVAKRYERDVDLTATRLTFFRSLPSSSRWDDREELPNNHLLGYAVVVTLTLPDNEHNTYLLEAVVRPPSIWIHNADNQISIEPITNYYVHNRRNFETTIGTKKHSRTFTLTGSFFTQQNDITHVCAHAALRMAVNSSLILTEEKLTNKKINDILGLDFSSPEKCVGHLEHDPPGTKEGLSIQDLEQVIHYLGGRTITAKFDSTNSFIEYDQFIYPFIESSCPVILGVERKDFNHAVAVLGHTLNTDRWEPEARIGYGELTKHYISATGWVGHYIINDDNFGMYLTLPSDMLKNPPPEPPQTNPNLHATMAIAIIPQDVKIAGWVAEHLALRMIQFFLTNISPHLSTHLSPKSTWINRLAHNHKYIVSRTLLQTRESYIKHIESLTEDARDFLTPEIRQSLNRLPDHVWVSEITLPHLYTGNKHKLGDVIVRADVSLVEVLEGESIEIIELIRLPGLMCFMSDNLGKKTFPCNIASHVPLIREEKTPLLLEW